jgi:hypothetical protein
VKYQQIVQDAAELLWRCLPENRVHVVKRTGCVDVSVYSSHLPCLLPQHGSRKKHERAIRLEGWQQDLLDEAPWPFIRACIRTDGCAFINRTDVHRPKPYEYLTYEFANCSTDIAALFRAMCSKVGVLTRATQDGRGVWHVRINRRESVALLEHHVGRKA